MRIAVCSLFRDSMKWCGEDINQVHRYFNQLTQQTFPLKDMYIHAIEGDSSDNTLEVLRGYAQNYSNFTLLQEDKSFGPVQSTGDINRIKSLASIGDIVLESALQNDIDWLLWIESDLIINNNLIETLLLTTQKCHQSSDCIIAPIVMLERRNIFYDTWGFRELDGTNWTNRQVIPKSPIPREMSSIGSCALIDVSLLRKGARFGQGAFVELCSRARNIGGAIYADTNTTIYHPGSKFSRQRWI